MKRIFFLFTLLLSIGVMNAQTAQQTTATPQERAHNQALRMQKSLTLTAEQTTKVEAVILSKNAAIDAVKADVSKTDAVKKQEIEKIKTDKEKELQAILTADQYTRYKAMQEQRKKRKEASSAPGQE